MSRYDFHFLDDVSLIYQRDSRERIYIRRKKKRDKLNKNSIRFLSELWFHIHSRWSKREKKGSYAEVA